MKLVFEIARAVLRYYRAKLHSLSKLILSSASFYLANEELAHLAESYCPSTPPHAGGDLFHLYLECFSSNATYRQYTAHVTAKTLDAGAWRTLFHSQKDGFGMFLFQALKSIGTSVNPHFQMRYVAAQAFGMTRSGLNFFAKLGVLSTSPPSGGQTKHTWRIALRLWIGEKFDSLFLFICPRVGPSPVSCGSTTLSSSFLAGY